MIDWFQVPSLRPQELWSDSSSSLSSSESEKND